MIIPARKKRSEDGIDDQLMAAVVSQGGPESPLAFETSNQLELHDSSNLLRRVLQELSKTQKKAIYVASKGISWREIAAKKVPVGTGATLQLVA